MALDSTLGRILATVRPEGSVASVRTLSPGGRRRTHRVSFVDADPIVVQRTTDARAVETEAHLIDAVATRTSVPVASVVGHGVTDGTAWLATRHVDGVDLHARITDYSPAIQRSLARRFGRYLAALHEAFVFEAPGRVVVAGERLTVNDDGLAVDDAAESHEWLRTYAETNVDRLPADFGSLRPELEGVLAESVAEPPDSTGTSSLFPWDLRPGNALVADGSITAVVDWEAPLSAPPGLSLAKTAYLVADWYVPPDRAADLRAALRAGYAAIRAPPSITPLHRVAAVASAAVDSRGRVTNPGYPPVDRAAAVAFHRRALSRALP